VSKFIESDSEPEETTDLFFHSVATERQSELKKNHKNRTTHRCFEKTVIDSSSKEDKPGVWNVWGDCIEKSIVLFSKN